MSTSPAPAAPPPLFPWHVVLLGVGGLILTVGLCCGILTVAAALNPTPTQAGEAPMDPAGWLFFLLLIVLPIVVTGVAAVWLGMRQLRFRREIAKHQRIIQLADQLGALTAVDVATSLGMTMSAAENLLNQLASDGICRLDMSEDGTTNYVFPRRLIP
jgi:uncharacterized membrane protein